MSHTKSANADTTHAAKAAPKPAARKAAGEGGAPAEIVQSLGNRGMQALLTQSAKSVPGAPPPANGRASFEPRAKQPVLEADELQQWLDRQTSSSAESGRIEEVLGQVRREIARRDAQAALPPVTSKAPPQARGPPAGVTPSRGRIAARPSSLPMVPLQARLEVGSVDDPLEHEAERVAGHVMRMPAPSTPPRCACRGTPGPDGECAACKASRVARLAITPAVPALRSAPASVGAALAGPGRPLDVATRAFFESRLDTDLSAVRIHDDATAAVSAHDVAAQAYTVGRDVVFGAGRYQPSSKAGRALLAHELAHVVQQNSGRTTPSIQRKPQTYTVRPDHAPLSAEEVLILMAMTSRKVSRAAAIKLIADDEYACGEHPACLSGVGDMKPIQFTIGQPEPKAKHPAPAKQAAPKKAAPPTVAPEPAIEAEQLTASAPLPAEIESALDDPYVKRFFAVGTKDKYLQLPEGQPSPADYASVNYIRDVVMRMNEKELASYRGFVAGQTLGTWTDIARSLHEFSKIKTGLPGAYDVDTGTVDRFRGAEPFYELIKQREVLEKALKELPHISSSSASVLPQPTAADVRNRARYEELGQQLTAVTKAQAQAFGALGFKTVAEFDQAANEFRLYFRANALTIAERMLFESGRVLQDAVRRYQLRQNHVPRDCQELYDELYGYGGRSVDQLKDAHPILRNPAALHAVRDAKNVYEFSWRLTGFANDRMRDLEFVQNNLRREPDVVFRWEPVVRATFDELGLEEDSIYGWVIREQRGKPGSTLGEKLIHYGVELLLFALSFVSLPVALTAAVAKAGYDTGAAAIDYGEQMRASEQGFREPPSIAPVIITPVVELAPFAAHGVFSWLRKLAGGPRVPRLAPVTTEPPVARPAVDVEPPVVPKPEPTPVTTEPAAGRPVVDVEPPVVPKPEPAPVTTEPAAGRPVVDIERPVVPKPVPVTTEPAVGGQAPKLPPVIEPDPRLVQAEERLATAQAKAEAARARLGAAGEKATAADEAAKVADAELAQARQEAKVARAERARAKKAYDRAKPGSRAAPRAEYTAAKNAAEKAESKVASAAKRANSAKKARGEAVRAVPRQEATVGRAEQAVTAAQEQRLIEAEADLIRKLPRNVEGLPPGWDYERFPNGPRRDWRPGDAINMPDAKGNYPVWATIRKRIWINRATDEQAGRAAGTRVRAPIPPKPTGPVDPTPAGWDPWGATDKELAARGWEKVPKGGLPWLDPIGEATDKELVAIASSGSMPSRLGAEIEHARIPQRAGDMLEAVGVDPNTARRVTKVGDPDNLMPTRKEIHAIVDEAARVTNPNRNPTLEFSLDVRSDAPFREATNEEIADIVKAIKNRRLAVPETEAQKQALEILRGFLKAEKKLRPSSTWEVP
jgi:hypothetical protein